MAIDTKHYSYVGALVSGITDASHRHFSTSTTTRLKQIQQVFNADSTLLPTRLVLINVYSTEQETAGLKKEADSEGQDIDHLYRLAVGDDPNTIAVNILRFLHDQ